MASLSCANSPSAYASYDVLVHQFAVLRPASSGLTLAGKPLPFTSSYRLLTTWFSTVIFLQRTFTSFVHAHAGRTQGAATEKLLADAAKFPQSAALGTRRIFVFSFETENLILRDMRQEDEDTFVALSQDGKYQRFYSEEDCDLDKYRELVELFISQALEVPRAAYQLAIELKETGDLIGTVCLRLEAGNQASMGCGLARQH